MHYSTIQPAQNAGNHRRQIRSLSLLLIAFYLAFSTATVEAATTTNSGSWFDGSIWDTRFAPTNSGDNSTVLTTVTLPYLAGIPTISLSSLTLAGGGSLGVGSPEHWVADTNLVGNGQVMPVSLPLPGATRRFYRLSEP